MRAGAYTCVRVVDVEAALEAVLLGREFEEFDEALPIVARAVNKVNVGISIQNRQMEVLWFNDRIRSIVGEVGVTPGHCWKVYHRFRHRKHACTGCPGARVLEEAMQDASAGTPVGNGRRTGYHLLPLSGKLHRLQVNAAPLSSRGGRKLLGFTDASHVVTPEWEKDILAHDRLHEVLVAARAMAQDGSEVPPPLAVALYYQPDVEQELHLFDVATENADTVPRLLRLADCPVAYREARDDQEPCLFREEGGSQPGWHFLWAGRPPTLQQPILIDVVCADEKSEGFLAEDLKPYWEYVLEHCDTAMETRDQSFEKSSNSFLQEFLGRTAGGIRDETGRDDAIRGAVECVEKALHPLGMHVRILDRTASALVKQDGFGPYYDMAPVNRELQYNGTGSAGAASTRNPIWVTHADMASIRETLDGHLSPDQEGKIQQITSYVTLPLIWMGRVLGTLNIQFNDDSLFSDAKCSFIRAMAAALASALGSLEWVHERRAVAQCSQDLDRRMFRRSDQPEVDELGILSQVTRMVFELTAAQVVAYYRYDVQSRRLTLVSGATQGVLPGGAMLPERMPPDVGVVSLSATDRRGYLVEDYREDSWRSVRNRLIGSFPDGPEKAFCRWVGSEIAEPVIAGDTVKGALVALSSVPRWLSNDDVRVVHEFAVKTGLCLEAKNLMRQLNWFLFTRIALNEITAVMARKSDEETLYRLFLLAVTTKECLGFSRAILFVRKNGDRDKLIAKEAVGAQSQRVAEIRWREAEPITLKNKMKICEDAPRARPGDLREKLSELAMDLTEHPDIRQSLTQGKTVARRRPQSHILCETQLRTVLYSAENSDCDYVVAPLMAGGDVIGAVLADRAFIPGDDHAQERVDLLQFLTGEFSLMLEAIKLRREEQEATIARDLAWGVSYSMRTRAAAMEGRLLNFANALQGAHAAKIDGLKRALKFFERAGTIPSKLSRLEQVPLGQGKPLDLDQVLDEVVDFLADSRIIVNRANRPVRVRAEREHLRDIFLEILWNACEFSHRQTGRIEVTVGAEGSMTRVDCEDNGPGIHPEFRPYLFKPFKCHPASRKGLGWGLYYAERLVIAYGGSIEEIGTCQHGAHFVVRLPLVEGQ